eukprot:1158047-Pelagomonas_calceolata.AAC.9
MAYLYPSTPRDKSPGALAQLGRNMHRTMMHENGGVKRKILASAVIFSMTKLDSGASTKHRNHECAIICT